MKLHELSVKRPIAVTMVILIFVIIGVYSLSMLSIEMMPEMDLSMAIVMTQYRNVGTEEIENLVTKKIEDAVSSVTGVSSMTSQSSEGVSIVMLEFNSGTDMDEAVQDMEDSIDMYSAMLPDDAEDPMVIKLDTSSMPVAMMSVSYEGYDLVQTKQFIEDNIENKLEAVEGVASVSVSGATDRVINVVINPDKLQGYNLSVNDIANAIAAQNLNLPAGSTEGMNKDMTVRAEGQYSKVSDIANTPVTTSTGQIIYVSDIAEINDTYSDEETIARLDGVEAISLSISAESDANTVNVVNSVTEALEEVKASNPKFSYNMTMESASYIEDAISSVAESAIEGGLLAILVLLLFLGNFRTSLVVGVSMPVAIVVTFIGMYFSKMTLNIVSLGGLSLGVGMLVDNSVVVIENIFRRRKELGEDKKTAAISGAGEMFGSVLASCLTTCIVYVPLLFVDNIMAAMFKQFAFVIIFSQVASIFTAFMIVPMLASKIENAEKQDKKLKFILDPFNKMMNKLYELYEKSLNWLLSHRKVFMTSVLALFVLAIFILTQLGMSLMPSSDEGSLSVSIELPVGSKLEAADKLTKEVEEIVKSHEDVKTVFASVGSGGMSAIMGSSSNQSSLTVTLNDDRKKTTNEVVQELRDMLSDVTGATIELSASSTAMSISTDEIQFNFSATDEDKLYDFIDDAREVLADIDGVQETSTSLSETQSELKIKLDPAKAARYGMTTSAVSSYIQAVLDGKTASTFKQSGSEYDIDIVYPENYVTDYTQIKTMQIKANSGQWITLGDIADVTVEQGSTTLTREDKKRTVSLTGVLFDTDMGTVNREFSKKMEQMGMPEGISMVTSGSYEIMIEAMQSLGIAIILGIVLMYMVMAAQFENVSHPFVILFTVPLSIIGVVAALLLTGSDVSVLTFMGVLMLIGIIVNNAIILIDFINIARKEHPEESRNEIIIRSALSRIRPILMTTITSVIGFMPMAVSTASGSEMMRPLAVALVGGLSIGSLLTLFVIPVIYSWMDDKLTKRREKKEKKKTAKAANATA